MLVALPAVAGCDSTFQQNARAKLGAERRLAAKEPQVVADRGSEVRVERVTLLTAPGSTAVVVDLRNHAARAYRDLPISVGVRRGARKVLLNDAPELDWFSTHVPAIAAGGRTTWVFRSPPGRRAKRGEVPFVRVGAPSERFAAAPPALPTLSARVTATTAGGATVELSEATVPQIGLPVNVVAREDDVPVAAGTALVPSLDRGERVTATVPLTGDPGAAPLVATSAPTIFE